MARSGRALRTGAIAVTLMAIAPGCGFDRRPRASPETIPSPSMPQLKMPAPEVPPPPAAPSLPSGEDIAPSPTTPNSLPTSPAPSYPPGDIP